MDIQTQRPSAISWQLPTFYCPFGHEQIHPQFERVEAETIAWLDAKGIYPTDRARDWGLAGNWAEFMCRISPTGPVERLILFSQWSYVLTSLDDDQDGDTTAG